MYYLVKYRKTPVNPNDYDIVKVDRYKSNLIKWLNKSYPAFKAYDDPRRERQHNNIIDGELYRIKRG